MGWGRMFLLGNIGQQMDIDDVKGYLNEAIDEINKGQAVDESQNDRLAKLERANVELKLALLMTTRLLAQKGVLTQADLNSIESAVEKS
jgi:hypothetical protein